MANDSLIEQLRSLAEAIMGLNEEKLMRPSLGPLSIEKEFYPRLESIKRKLGNAIELAPQVSDRQLQEFIENMTAIKSAMEAHTKWEDREYASERDPFLENMDNMLYQLDTSWLPFSNAIIEKRGFLDDESLRQQHESTLQRLKEESEKYLASVKDQADQIKKDARLTAAGISVKEAQDQFSAAQPDLNKQMRIWAGLSIFGGFVFIGSALYFLSAEVPDQWQWQIIYKGVLRGSLIAFFGTITAFFLKMFRAHLYMREKNKHRVRVANCIEAFVNSAATEEQRDSILSQLVDSVTQFGSSGLLQREDDNVSRPKMSIESMIKTLSTKPPT